MTTTLYHPLTKDKEAFLGFVAKIKTEGFQFLLDRFLETPEDDKQLYKAAGLKAPKGGGEFVKLYRGEVFDDLPGIPNTIVLVATINKPVSKMCEEYEGMVRTVPLGLKTKEHLRPSATVLPSPRHSWLA